MAATNWRLGTLDVLLTLLFLAAVGLTGSKLNDDFADKGVLGWSMLLILTIVYAGLVSLGG